MPQPTREVRRSDVAAGRTINANTNSTADHLGGLGNCDSDDNKEQHGNRTKRNAPGLGELGRECGEEQPPRRCRKRAHAYSA